MLDLIRKKQQSTIIKFVFWAIIATFVGTIFLVWGKGSDRASNGGTLAATVNDRQIAITDYQRAYRNLYQFYQNLYKEKFNAEMEKQLGIARTAIDQLVRQVLLEEEGDRLGIEVSRQELVDSISQIPQFQRDGVFDRQTYLQVLEYQRLTPDEFEAAQQSTLFAEKVEEQIMSSVTVTDADIEDEFRKENEKVNLSFVRLAPALFESKVEVADEALETYFQDNQEEFRVPTKIAIRYLQFEPGRYEDDVVLEQNDIEKYYQRHLDKFEIEEQVSAAHVLVKLDQDADDKTKEEKRKLAETILEKAKTGEDFAKLARTYSDDTGSAAKGGSLGYFTRGTMVPSFEKAAFALKPGQISDIVESPFGLHIIKADGYIEPSVKPIDEVIDTIKADLRKEMAVTVAFEKAMDAYNINRKTGDLDKAAADNDLGVKESGLFDRVTPIDGISESSEITAAAFALDMNELARPIRLKSGIYLVGLKERKESHIPEFADVKKEVEAAYRKQQAVGLAKAAADEILAGLKEGKKLSALSKKSGAKVEETGLFAESYGAFVPRLGNAEELATQAFDLTEENPVAPRVYELGGRFVVASLKKLEPADMSKLDDEKRAELREKVNNSKRREVLENRIAELKAAAEIVYTPYMQSMLERG
ncbi:MAG: hypothetical protein C0615_05585 [Desulfuromonas sp.]|nr:MAG: hypothetical protein C0615_05585 [Desulfuromonas sp.]